MSIRADLALFIAVVGLGLLLSVVMNILVIIIFLKNVKLRSATNLLISNLALSDVFMAAFILPQNLHDITHEEEFHEGEFACRIVNALPLFCICSSIFSLVAMSVERRRAICNVNSTPMASSQVKWVIIGVWLLSTTVAAPTAIEYSVYTYDKTLFIPHLSDGEEDGLMLNITTTTSPLTTTNFTENYIDWYYVSQDINGSYYWALGHGCGSQMNRIYNIVNAFFILFCAYIIPLVIICYNYACLVIFINRESKRNTTSGQRQGQVSRKRVRIVKMLILVATLFAICWCPYFVLLSVAKITGEDDLRNTTGALFLLKIILSAFSVSYNVYLYLAYNAVFREHFRRLVCPCIRAAQVAPEMEDTAVNTDQAAGARALSTRADVPHPKPSTFTGRTDA